jgi:hypothetical protein
LRQQMQQRNITRIFRTDGSHDSIDLGLRYGLFGQFFGDTFISAASSPAASPALACFHNEVPSARDDAAGALLWRADVGPMVVDVPGVGRGGGLRRLHGTDDGRVLTSGVDHVYVAAYPYLGWTEVVATSTDDKPDFASPISISADGSLLMGYSTSSWFFARPDEPTWTEVEARGPASLLLATDEFAIVMDERGPSRLYKVPLNGLLE